MAEGCHRDDRTALMRGANELRAGSGDTPCGQRCLHAFSQLPMITKWVTSMLRVEVTHASNQCCPVAGNLCIGTDMSRLRQTGRDNVETSDSKPITVSWIVRGSEASSSGGGSHAAPQQPHAQIPVVSGALGLCYCPGKQHTRGGRRIARSLDADLSHLREHHKVDCLVCLLNDAELRVRLGG